MYFFLLNNLARKGLIDAEDDWFAIIILNWQNIHELQYASAFSVITDVFDNQLFKEWQMSMKLK